MESSKNLVTEDTVTKRIARASMTRNGSPQRRDGWAAREPAAVTGLPEDRYIQVGGVTTRYWTAGEAGPALLLLHGFGGGVEDWSLNIAPLAANHRVFALDLIGCGRTEKPAVQYSIECFARFVADFMSAVGVARASIVGHSMGGAIALAFARTYPHRLGSLVIVDGAGFGREISFGSRLATVPVLGEMLMVPTRAGVVYFLRQALFDRSRIAEDAISILHARQSLPGARRAMLAILRSLATLRGARREVVAPLLAGLGAVTAPTLVMWGREDRFLPAAHAEVATRSIPNARLHLFEACGHAPHYERTEEFNALVGEFLDASGG